VFYGWDTRGDLGDGYYKNSLGTRLQFKAVFGNNLWYASDVKTVCYAAAVTDEMTTKDVETVRNSHDRTACATHADVCA